MNDDAPGIGHNAPPPPPSLDLTAEGWTERMQHVFTEAQKRHDDLLASYQRFHDIYKLDRNDDGPPFGIENWSEEIQGRAGDLRDKLRLLIRNADALHDLEKEPVLIASTTIDGFLRRFKDPLQTAMRVIQQRQTLFAKHMDDESRRAAREEAARAAAAAEAAMANAAQTMDEDALQTAADKATEASAIARHAEARPAEHTRVRGDLGSVTSLRTTWTFDIERSDLVELAKAVVLGHAPASYLQFNTTRINLAIRVEGIRNIPGCVIREESVAR